MSRRALALATALLISLVPTAGLAGTAVEHPGGMHCIVVNTDGCEVGPLDPIAIWGWGFEGVFVGDLTLTTEAGGLWHAVVCKDIVLVGILFLDQGTNILGNCEHLGIDPPQDEPVFMGCYSEGVGVAVCSLLD